MVISALAVTAARTDRKIEAVKMYRELIGVDLRTALDAVEAIMVRRTPERAAKQDRPHW